MTPTRRPMRATVRRKLIRKAIDEGEKRAAAKLSVSLKRQYSQLSRELRRANLRKRMEKSARGGSATDALYKDIGWRAWVEQFTDAIKDALGSIADAVHGVEREFFESRGMAIPPTVDVNKVITAYENRVGRQISDIAEDTHRAVLNEVASWYNNPASGMSELMASLSPYFDPARAELIARTESAYIASQVAIDDMYALGLKEWNFDLAPDEGPWPCPECLGYAAANPHTLDDDFPPLHPGDRCGIVYLDRDGTPI